MSELDAPAVPEPDTIVLRSAGIDIGSATTHLVTSRITMKRLGRSHSSRYVIVDRELEFVSPVALTPYVDRELIDADALLSILTDWVGDDAYDEDSIDTGVVLLTGEAARRRNTRQITERVSRLAGEFVCAAAGDLFEVDMAAHGSGSVGLSEAEPAVLNIDIGGGTTKISVCRGGTIETRGVFRVGARAIVVDDDDRINRMEEPGDLAVSALGIDVGLGDTISEEDRTRAGLWLIDRLAEFMQGNLDHPATAALTIVPLPPIPDDVSTVVFSSGVGEYIYERESETFGDLAPWIAEGVRSQRDTGAWPWKWHMPEASPIRATVTGIAEQTVEMSGDTIFVSSPDLLPLRNREVRTVDATDEISATGIADRMREALDTDSLSTVDGGIIWDVRCGPRRDFAYLSELAHGLAQGARSGSDGPVGILLNRDIAMLVGRLLSDELELLPEVVVLDGISLHDVHFVDFGRYREESNTVPVVLKSLVFVDRADD